MNRQIVFTYNNNRFYSTHGSSFFREQLSNTNVISQAELFQKASYQQAFLQINGNKNYRAALPVEDAVVEKVGNYYYVTGKVSVDGVTYNVNYNREFLRFEEVREPLPDIEPLEEEEIVEEVKEEEPVPEPKVKPEPEPLPDIEPLEEDEVVEEIVEHTEEIEEEPPAPVPTVAEEPPATPVVEEPAPIPAVVEEPPAPVVVEEEKPPSPPVVKAEPPKTPTVTSTKFSTVGLTIGAKPKAKALPTSMCEGKSTKNRIEFKEKNMPTRGIVFGVRQNDNVSDSEMPMGHKELNKAGISFGQRVVTRTPAHKALRNEALRQQVIQSRAEKETVDEDDVQRLQKAWSQPMQPKQRYDSMQPVPTEFKPELSPTPEPIEISPDEGVVKDDTSKLTREEAKALVRKDLPDDINKVIGDIPIELLGSISEFTMDTINVVELLNGKDIYCIDRRWHKQGKWFCIDVVANCSRYFYNSRLNVNIEIPVKVLKEWKEALSA